MTLEYPHLANGINQSLQKDAVIFPIITRGEVIENRPFFEEFTDRFNNWYYHKTISDYNKQLFENEKENLLNTSTTIFIGEESLLVTGPLSLLDKYWIR